MSTPVEPAPAPAAVHQHRQPKRSPWLRRLGMAGAAIVILLVGVGIGQAGRVSTSKLDAAQQDARTESAKVTTLAGELATARTQEATAKTQDATAKSEASHALSIATGQAAHRYAAKEAALSSLQAQASSEKRQYQQLIGNVQASSISADGVYVVGTNIKAGTWYTPGDGGSGDQCYYATLNSTNTNDISGNNNFDGSETVDLNGVYAFQISGGCSWSRTGS
jgi:hypothetical protein